MDVVVSSKFVERAIADLDPVRSRMGPGQLTLGAQLLLGFPAIPKAQGTSAQEQTI